MPNDRRTNRFLKWIPLNIVWGLDYASDAIKIPFFSNWQVNIASQWMHIRLSHWSISLGLLNKSWLLHTLFSPTYLKCDWISRVWWNLGLSMTSIFPINGFVRGVSIIQRARYVSWEPAFAFLLQYFEDAAHLLIVRRLRSLHDQYPF